MKKFLFTALLVFAFTFTTSAATTSEVEPIQSIELTENMIIANPGDIVDEDDCTYAGVYAVYVNGRFAGFYDVYIC
jgi:hypothetical protein